MDPIRQITSRTVVLPVADVDTDQIIPARFLTTTSKDGLGKHLFADWRYQASGEPNPGFALNQPQAQGCRVLVADRNFGCGSSREHAPWALLDYGIAVVISSEFADIFRSNSLKNGLLPVLVEQDVLDWLLNNPGVEVSIDIASSTLLLPDGRSVEYPIDDFARYCLLEGVDQLGFLLKHAADINQFEENRSWTP
ncbi:3-isopropylmalate dehydratase small subunit [Woeseia oceani]|uniref:3-isopropylmalate dehydratase small subunit n=1 Tax=Woeseia oceani TaxID=1548547 RepID=A0A193LG42_9GAMM|nr:3-isopropylmalate dehydratase small subunit [Woeseia oceani]ANO51433.1 3-isopropylmalate dehydratase small subunit [Woeseia oceani]